MSVQDLIPAAQRFLSSLVDSPQRHRDTEDHREEKGKAPQAIISLPIEYLDMEKTALRAFLLLCGPLCLCVSVVNLNPSAEALDRTLGTMIACGAFFFLRAFVSSW